jgi:hypothetical protein
LIEHEDEIEKNLFYAPGKEIFEWISTEIDTIIAIQARFVGKLKELGTTWKGGWNGEFDFATARILFMELIGFFQKGGMFKSTKELASVFWQIPIGNKDMGPLGLTQRATATSL